MNSIRKRDTRIPRKPFLWLTAALVFTVPPMFGALALWVPILFLTVLAAKFWMEPRDYRLRSPLWKLLLGAVVLAAVFVTYGSVEGIEPGVSIVVILMSLKILEAHTSREFQVMAHIGWILCLCGFFLSQDFAVALCVLVGVTLLLVALIEFHRGPGTGSLWLPLRTAATILCQAIPLIVALFIFFPRTNIGVRLQFPGSQMNGTGFSGQLSPGSVSALANSTDIAFRAEFPDGRIPKPDNLYWRGAVMWHGNAFEWRAAEAPPSISRSSRRLPVSAPVRQWITIEPQGNHWMFALDWPVEAPPGAITAPGNYLWSGQPIRSTKKYEVNSFLEIADKELHPRERKMLLDVPSSITPAVQDLALSWVDGAATPADVVRRGLEFFHSEGFRYSLSPGQYRNNDLEGFLFKRKIGFCEHYAASFATLMRLAGIPARVVVGYLGGEYNELGHFFIVRQSDSHAWCEVWLPEKGWRRVDPTSVVAPDRVTLGLNGFLERRTVSNAGASPNIVRNLAHSHILNNARLAWQAVNYAWDTRVLSFDDGAQFSLLSSIGTSESPFRLIIGGIAAIGFILALWFGWAQFRNRQGRDSLKQLYDKFCGKLASLGAKRHPAEGPRDFSARAAQLLPEQSERIRAISDSYITLRYSEAAERNLKSRFKEEVYSFSRMKPSTSQGS